MSHTSTLDALVALTRELGRPALDYVILGEGNTSLLRDEHSFWVSASGAELGAVDRSSFVAMRFAPVLALLDGEPDRAATQAAFTEAVCEGVGRPSSEVALHALALTLGGARVVAHTHPTPLLAVLCATNARALVAKRLFPDEVIVNGVAPAYVPYVAPGLPLARAVKATLLAYREQWGVPPKALLLENHGLIALGQTPAEALRVTAMWVKTARVLLGAVALGGPRFLSATEVDRLATYMAARGNG